MTPDLDLAVAGTETIAPGIRQLTLVARDGGSLRAFRPGSHIGLRWRDGRVNFYSLTGDGDCPDHYTISVLRAPEGRGGSAWAHRLRAGDAVTAVPPRSAFAPVATARRHLLVAGGIGITPLLSHARWHARQGSDFTLYYVHKPGRAAHLDQLRDLCGERLRGYHGREQLWADLGPALTRQPLGTCLYACGPLPLLDAVTTAASELRWPAGRVRSEKFGAADDGPRSPFRVSFPGSERTVQVSSESTLLDALERAGVPVASMCRQGVCGECRIPVAGGAIDHRDLVLTPAEKASGQWVMPCVSRAAGDELELLL